ncbi:hypothetical protein T03_4532 [Trichinella britovi]|uniref:Uncharacterized protein n=1 Tax=Trichinella britovi TaxID=45882 RepID=A0A0V1CF00_TRIBR|nr:hypothetical protein T03_4532 [Trichinella britovi]
MCMRLQAYDLRLRDDSHLRGSARHLVRKLRLRRIRMAIWSVEGGSGRHEADRGRHEADRGRHEAEQEKTKFLGPQFCRSGIGILRKGEVIP